MSFTDKEIDIIVAGIRGGHEVHIGSSRCHTTYRGRGGELFSEDFDEGEAIESPLTEASLRETIAGDPASFMEVLRAPLRAALSDALLSNRGDPHVALGELLAHGECLDRRHLLEAVLAWPTPPSAEALSELATLHGGLDFFHFVRGAIGYKVHSAAAGEFGLRVFATLAEMAKPREIPQLRRYRADFRVMRGDFEGAIEDLEWEFARLPPNDSDVAHLTKQLARLTDRHISAQILALADDDAPRLVWADALAERGDPRGEFIVAQCALARADPDDPLHATLGPRASQLLAHHRWDWGAKHGCRFERGFVAALEVRWTTFAEDADAIFGWAPPLRELRFCVSPGDYIPSPASVLDEPRLERIRSLHFEDPVFRIDNDAVGDIVLPFEAVEVPFGSEIVARLHDRLPQLESLGLSGARLHAEAHVLIGKRLGLKRLKLVRCEVDDERVAQLAGLTQLEELDLTGSRIRALPGLPSLRRLRVGACAPSVLAHRALTSLACEDLDFDALLPPSLQRLALGSGVMPRLADLPRLWELELHERSLDIAKLLDALPSLRSLRLRGCHLGDAGLAALVAHPVFERLERLDLENNELSAEAARILARAPRLPQRLLLAENLLGDAGARAIAEAPGAARIVDLDLGHNGLTTEGARLVALDSPHLANLGSLRIAGNPVDPDTMQDCYNRLRDRLVRA